MKKLAKKFDINSVSSLVDFLTALLFIFQVHALLCIAYILSVISDCMEDIDRDLMSGKLIEVSVWGTTFSIERIIQRVQWNHSVADLLCWSILFVRTSHFAKELFIQLQSFNSDCLHYSFA